MSGDKISDIDLLYLSKDNLIECAKGLLSGDDKNKSTEGDEKNKSTENDDKNKGTEDKDFFSRLWSLISNWFLKKIFLRGAEISHLDLSEEVYGRLVLRAAQLKLVNRYARDQADLEPPICDDPTTSKSFFQTVNLRTCKEKDESTSINTEPNSEARVKWDQYSINLRAYHLAVTDLFVEKALAYLEAQANTYKKLGWAAYLIGLLVLVVTIAFSFENTLKTINYGFFLSDNAYLVALISFARSFTFFGLMVLLSVALWRFGKAMLDQSERLMDRRHALRQGRLFVHLSDGKISIEDMIKAFNWNVSLDNAFTNITTDAKAPWGAALGDAMKISSDLIKKGGDIAVDLRKKSDKN